MLPLQQLMPGCSFLLCLPSPSLLFCFLFPPPLPPFAPFLLSLILSTLYCLFFLLEGNQMQLLIVYTQNTDYFCDVKSHGGFSPRQQASKIFCRRRHLGLLTLNSMMTPRTRSMEHLTDEGASTPKLFLRQTQSRPLIGRLQIGAPRTSSLGYVV